MQGASSVGVRSRSPYSYSQVSHSTRRYGNQHETGIGTRLGWHRADQAAVALSNQASRPDPTGVRCRLKGPEPDDRAEEGPDGCRSSRTQDA